MKFSRYHVVPGSGPSFPRPHAAILLIAAGMLLVPCRAFPQIEDDGTKAVLILEDNVVRVEAQMRGHVEKGFGFIVAEKDGSLYIVTADHVVSDPKAKNQRGHAQVKVQFSGLYDGVHAGGGPMYDAKLMETRDSKHDLAVLTLPPPPGTRWKSRCMGVLREQQRPAELYFIGKSKGPESANWFSAPTPGHVTSGAPVGPEITVDGLWAASGSAGGPVIGASGIVAMIQHSTPDHTRALSIDFIKAAFLKWNYPWNLEYATNAKAGYDPEGWHTH